MHFDEILMSPKYAILEIIRANRKADTINEENIGELIRICFDRMPDGKQEILCYIERAFPELKNSIEKYKILL